MPGARRKVAKGRVYWCPDRWSPSIWSGTPEEEAAQLHEIARLLAGARDHRPAQGTIARAVAEFMGDEKWRGYSDGTQRNWLPHLEWLRDELGWMSGAEFAAAGKQILAHHAALAKRAPRTADMFLQAVSRFSTWASAPRSTMRRAGPSSFGRRVMTEMPASASRPGLTSRVSTG
ncbi:MAG: hypothetical protein EBR82_47075 [Caulobacteraceae bacterium]|nr:hypothetical protein [Caulobacteraceae bacterium]